MLLKRVVSIYCVVAKGFIVVKTELYFSLSVLFFPNLSFIAEEITTYPSGFNIGIKCIVKSSNTILFLLSNSLNLKQKLLLLFH